MSGTGLATITATLALLSAACGGGEGNSSLGASSVSGTDTSVGEGVTTAAPPVEGEVIEDYLAAKEALYAAFHPPDSEDPGLLAHWDGEALSTGQQLLSQLEAGGTSWVATLETNPTVVSVNGDSAIVRDCVLDHIQAVDAATEEPIGEEQESLTHVDSHLERIDGTWKIVQEEELSEPCTSG
jgi:hypothetical protein